MSKKVFVIGVGMTKFEKPKPLVEYTDLGKEAVTKALSDAKIDYNKVEVSAEMRSARQTCRSWLS